MKEITKIDELNGFVRVNGLKRCYIDLILSGVASDFYSEKHISKYNIPSDKEMIQITLITNDDETIKRAFTPSVNSPMYNFFKGAILGETYDVLFSNGKIIHAVKGKDI